MKDFSVANPYTNNQPFPNTKAKVASPGQNDGTVLNADLVDETFGFYQAALNSAGYTPSGTVDNATTSQVLNAIFKHTDDAVDLIQSDINTIEGDIGYLKQQTGEAVTFVAQIKVWVIGTPGFTIVTPDPKVTLIMGLDRSTLIIQEYCYTDTDLQSGYRRVSIQIPDQIQLRMNYYGLDNCKGSFLYPTGGLADGVVPSFYDCEYTENTDYFGVDKKGFILYNREAVPNYPRVVFSSGSNFEVFQTR